MKYSITYTDNQDLIHTATAFASTFDSAIRSVEIVANEIGHGMKACAVTRTNEAETI